MHISEGVWIDTASVNVTLLVAIQITGNSLSQQAICWKWILQIHLYPHKLFLCSFYYGVDVRKWKFRISLGVHHMGLAKWFLGDWLAFTQPLKWGLSLWTLYVEKSAKIHCLWKGIKQFVWRVSICVKRKRLLTHTQTHWVWRVQGYQTYCLLLEGGGRWGIIFTLYLLIFLEFWNM